MEGNSSNGGNNGSAKGWKGIFLRTWHPTPTVNTTILLFSILGLIFIIFGIVLFVINSKIKEFSVRYDTICKSYGAVCDVSIEVSEEMESPVFVFYELHNFYQNHRRYIKSKSASQLSGEVIDEKAAKTACDPVITNRDMGVTKAFDKVTDLPQTGVASPCGLIAKSFFNDTFVLVSKGGDEIKINDKGISWPNDVGKKFKRANSYLTTQWIDPEDEHFVVWMRTAGLPDFRKLWGKIEKNVAKGNYTFKVTNNYNVNRFNGEKHIVLSTSGPFGGKNSFLAISYVVIGSICFLIAIIFFAKNKISGGTFGESKKNE